jgi:hypothetical protein
MQAKSLIGPLYPFVVTRERFDALLRYRKTLKRESKVEDAPKLVVDLLLDLQDFLTGRRQQEKTGSIKNEVDSD